MLANRLFEIVYLLMERGSLTAGQLAEHFEVSTRTIYRDIDALSGAGIPVYSSKGKGGGIKLMAGFVLDKSLISQKEQDEILFALQSLKATNAGGEDTLTRLSRLFQKENVEWIDVDFSRWESSDEEKQTFQILKTAILEHQVTSFIYYNSHGEQGERLVEPVRLRFKHGEWYLQGFCQQKQGWRTFKICRMDKVNLTGLSFSPRQDPIPEMEANSWNDCGWVELKLLFPPHLAFRVYDEFSRNNIKIQEDGSYLATTVYPYGDWLFSYLLSYGEDVKVVSPEEIRKTMKEKLKRMCSYY